MRHIINFRFGKLVVILRPETKQFQQNIFFKVIRPKAEISELKSKTQVQLTENEIRHTSVFVTDPDDF